MNNRSIVLLFCLFLTSSASFCQKNTLQVAPEKKILGKNYIDKSDIEGIEYQFPGKIERAFHDTTEKLLTVQLKDVTKSGRVKESGNILQYDVINKEILWTKRLEYNTFELLKFDDLLILNDYNDSYGLDKKTGENLWEINNYMAFAYPEKNIGITYIFNEVHGEYTNNLIGLDLQKRKIIWTRNISRDFGWNDYFLLNDSTLTIVAAGLHAINLYTGKGWDYNAKTGKIDPSSGSYMMGTMMGVMFGAIGGLIGGLLDGALSGGATNLTRDVVSNVLIDSAFIYFSSKDELSKLDKETGEFVWKTSFDKDLVSKSFIFMDDSFVYMLNYGFAYRGGKQIDYGAPFIAAFDRQTGKEKYVQFTDNQFGTILDFKRVYNRIYLLFKNRIALYDLELGGKFFDKVFPKKEFGELHSFIRDKTFVMNNNADFIHLAHDDPTRLHFYNNQGEILSADEILNVKNTYQITGVSFLHYEDYKLIANGYNTFIVNSEGKIVAEIEVTSNAFLMGGVLYDVRDRSVVATDLKEIF